MLYSLLSTLNMKIAITNLLATKVISRRKDLEKNEIDIIVFEFFVKCA